MHPTATPQVLLPSPFVAKDKLGPFRMRRLLVVLIYFALAVAPGELGPLTRSLMVWSTSNLQAMTNAKDSPVTRMAEETGLSPSG